MQQFTWSDLGSAEKQRLLARPGSRDDGKIHSAVAGIIADVRRRGDAAVNEYARRFDKACGPLRKVAAAEFEGAERQLSGEIKAAMRGAAANISRFHAAQQPQGLEIEVCPGVRCAKVYRPLQSVGLYVPGGSAALPSTLLMLGVPSRLAGCRQRVVCTPPAAGGLPDPAVLYAAKLTGIEQVFAVGGAQAIAALAYGTETIPSVDKIFGPGNRYVTAAKQQVARDPRAAGIDMPAGPSEVMVIADNGARADIVAADLLSQAEHGEDSQVILVSSASRLISAVTAALREQLGALNRRDIAAAALENSFSIRVADQAEAAEVANAYAPEHLILNVADPQALLRDVHSAGSVFLGAWSAEALGDYCSGTNHVLPTNGYARYLSGLSVQDFMRAMTVQEISEDGLLQIGPWAVELANYEGLDAHARAVTRRLAMLCKRASA